ncbi:UNVERIFIED_CONTAM: hypothetical protein FKN15_016974 [Acipenser sinensis]
METICLTAFFGFLRSSEFAVPSASSFPAAVLKKLAPFELPYMTLKSMNDEQCMIMIRKRFSVPDLGTSTGNPSEEDGIKLELSFEYCYGNDTWKWITIHTHQAFLLSTFMHQVEAEHAAKNLEMNSEMQIEMPDAQIKKQSFPKYLKTDKARPTLTRIKSTVQGSKDDDVFEGIQDKDL